MAIRPDDVYVLSDEDRTSANLIERKIDESITKRFASHTPVPDELFFTLKENVSWTALYEIERRFRVAGWHVNIHNFGKGDRQRIKFRLPQRTIGIAGIKRVNHYESANED